MKQRGWILMLGLFLLGALAACQPSPGAETQSPDQGAPADWELRVIAAQGSGVPLPAETVFDGAVLLTETAGWSYYQGTASYEGQTFAALWRTKGSGEAESLCSIHQPQGEGAPHHQLTYQLGAVESAGRYLYFTICSGQTGEQSLWFLDTQALAFRQMYAAPCSNLVRLLDTGTEEQVLGWTVHDRFLISIDLAQGSEYTAGVQALPNELFPEKDGEASAVELADGGGRLLRITVAPGTAQEKSGTFDVATGTFA